MAQDELTISSILQELAAHYDGIVTEREVFERVLARRPSRAKDPYAGIREKLRFGASRIGWVRLGDGKLMPLRVALDGLRFRVIPDDEEFAGSVILRSRLEPFVAADERELRLEDDAGRPLLAREAALPIGKGIFGPVSLPALDLSAWFAREHFAPGDSILMTVRVTAPLTLCLEHEPAAAFRLDDVLHQEHELLDALAEQLARRRVDVLFPEDSVLPIYARASWRTSYPGRPWQRLVANDPRMRLVDGTCIADTSFRPPLDLIFNGGEDDERIQEELDLALLEEISSFQAELRRSRREAAESGLWDGLAPRISTARVVFDQGDTPETIYAGPVDALQDHSPEIEERAAHGGYDNQWDDAFELDDFDDMEIDGEFDADDELFEIDDIEDMRAFMEQNPALVEATHRLMASLSSDEIERLQQAETPDDVQRILTKRLNELLFREPALFVTLAPAAASPTNGNGNGHGPHPDESPFDEEEWGDDELFEEDDWDEQDDDDEDDRQDEELGRLEEMLERSSDLMEQFYQYLIEHGKSETTAANRAGDLWAYAQFLGNYYSRSLDEGDYTTLDECLFFFYPRKMFNSSPRQAREMCTSIKQFYAFLRAKSIVADDAFAQGMWRRRDQAARVVELYDRLDSNSPRFERLFARLFEPYTV